MQILGRLSLEERRDRRGNQRKERGLVMARRKSKKAVYESLIEQLILKGADVACFVDLIDKYMELWDIDRLLDKDIKERGIIVETPSSVGVMTVKRNPSIKEKVAVNRQMLSILKQLQINTQEASDGRIDESL
jgi:phage terminase small subunit